MSANTSNEYNNSFDITINSILSCQGNCSATVNVPSLNIPTNIVNYFSGLGFNITTLPQLIDAITGYVGVGNTINYIQIVYYVNVTGSVGNNNCAYELYVSTYYSDNSSSSTALISSGTNSHSINSGWISVSSPTISIMTKIGSSESNTSCAFDSSGDWDVTFDLKANVIIDIESLCQTSFAVGSGYQLCQSFQSAFPVPPTPNQPPAPTYQSLAPTYAHAPINKAPTQPPTQQSFWSKYWWIFLIIFVLILLIIIFVIATAIRKNKQKLKVKKINKS
jgi:hypothetical protein